MIESKIKNISTQIVLRKINLIENIFRKGFSLRWFDYSGILEEVDFEQLKKISLVIEVPQINVLNLKTDELMSFDIKSKSYDQFDSWWRENLFFVGRYLIFCNSTEFGVYVDDEVNFLICGLKLGGLVSDLNISFNEELTKEVAHQLFIARTTLANR